MYGESALVSNLMRMNNAVVLDREIHEDDRIDYSLPLVDFDRVRVILDVPEDVTVDSLKRILEGIGEFSHDEWKYAYRVMFQRDLDEKKHKEILDCVEEYIDRQAAQDYDDLLDRLGEEKRITLRVPMGLHTMLISACKGKSLNTFCMEVLSKAVGFEGVPVASATKKD